MKGQLPEFLEWFITPKGNVLKGISVEDTPKEQEDPPASKQKFENGKPVGTIFLEDDETSDDNYKKLFKSILFRLNPSHRAKDSNSVDYKSKKGDVVSGHVTVATNKEAYEWDNGDCDAYTRTVRPEQLPEVNEKDADYIGDFAINTINPNPKDTIDVEKEERTDNDGNLLRALYTVRLKFDFLAWIKDITAKTKSYIDSYILHGGEVTVSNTNPNAISIDTINATNVASKQHEVHLNLFVSDNSDLSAVRPDVVVSENAIHQAIQTEIANSGHVTNLDLTNALSNYYTQAEVDAAITAVTDPLEARITALESAIAAIDLTQFYTQAEVDALLANKSDITHNHDNTYHPLVANTIPNGDITFQRLSQATVQDGILVQFNT